MRFLRSVWANIRLQHKQYFFNKRIYLSLFLWPVIGFINIYYSYQPFDQSFLMKKIGLASKEALYLYLLIGFVAMRFFYSLIQSAWQSAYAIRISGALELLYMSPANRMAMIMGNSIASLFGSIWMFIIFASGMIMMFRGHLDINPLSAIMSVILLCVLAVIWGMFLNSLFLMARDSGFLFTVFQGPVEMFSGAKIPFAYLPIWAKVFGSVVPLTYVIMVLRKAFMYQAPVHTLMPYVLLSLGIGILLLGLSYLMMRVGERNAMRHGTATLF